MCVYVCVHVCMRKEIVYILKNLDFFGKILTNSVLTTSSNPSISKITTRNKMQKTHLIYHTEINLSICIALFYIKFAIFFLTNIKTFENFHFSRMFERQTCKFMAKTKQMPPSKIPHSVLSYFLVLILSYRLRRVSKFYVK